MPAGRPTTAAAQSQCGRLGGGVPVDISDILHVLAHELRTPVGIAHGYVRLLLDERIGEAADRRRALEQTQKALARLTALSHETTSLAAWYERDEPGAQGRVTVREFVERLAAAEFAHPLTIEAPPVPGSLLLRGHDLPGVTDAVAGLVRATAREVRGETCRVSFHVADRHVDVLAGPESQLAALAQGPDAPAAGPIALERGGLGLTLIHAALVLDAHGAQQWTQNGSRQTAGIRLPLEEPRP